jgi:hypothetical protein
MFHMVRCPLLPPARKLGKIYDKRILQSGVTTQTLKILRLLHRARNDNYLSHHKWTETQQRKHNPVISNESARILTSEVTVTFQIHYNLFGNSQ